jgi:hypothetical protein
MSSANAQAVLAARLRQQLGPALEKAVKQRSGVLRAMLTPHLSGSIVVGHQDRPAHNDGTPQISIQLVGEARTIGGVLKKAPHISFRIQETIALPDSPKPSHIVHYTYAFHDTDTGEPLFRFEYHPRIPASPSGRHPFKQQHHLHIEVQSPKWYVVDLHVPVWPFLDEPSLAPETVLPAILEWSAREF